MGNCCTSRLPNAAIDTALPLQCQSRLSDILSKLSHHYNSLEKLNFHLSHFKAKSATHTSLVGKLIQEVASYKNKREQEKTSVEDTIAILATIDAELQKKQISGSQDEQGKLLGVIQVLEAGNQVESLRLCSESLGIYLESEDREKVGMLLMQASQAVQTTSSSLLCYIKFLEDAKLDLKTVHAYFQSNGEITGNEKVDNAKDRISKLRLATSALLSTIETQTKTSLKSFQQIERTIEDLRMEMQSCVEAESREMAEAGKVQKAAEYYLSLLKEETVVVPSRRYAKAAISYFLPATQSPLFKKSGAIRTFHQQSSAKPAETPISPDDLYSSLISLYLGKAQADLSAIRSNTSPESLESYLLTRLPAAHGFLPSLSQLTQGLKRLGPVPMAKLACELFRLSSASEACSLHEEVFLMRAVAKLETPIQEENWPVSAAGKWESGGLVDLETAFELVQSWFSEDLETAGKVIAAISAEISLSALSVSYIIHRLSALNLTAEDLFRKLDSRKANILSKEDFVEGISSVLGVFLPSNCLEEVTFLLDKSSSNCIFRTEFAQLFQPNNFVRTCISRISLLTALRKAHKAWQNTTRSQLYSEFLALPLRSNRASEADMETLLRKLDPALATAQIRMYVQKIVEIGGRDIDFEAFAGCLQLFPLGKWGKSFYGKD